ncbi:MAG TPA: FtsX-like permease family protein, partial [Bryobacteraceae bacterium]
IPFLKQMSLDLPVLGFAALISIVTGAIFGIAPAAAAFRARVYETLKEGAAASGESRGRNRFRSALVVAEVALSLLLAVGASLMMSTLLHLQQASPGFEAQGVLTAAITLPASKYPQPAQRIAFYRDALERIAAMPGAQTASMSSLVPLGGSNVGVGLVLEGQPPPRPGEMPIFYQRIVDPNYFRAMRIPLRRGREFTAQDTGSPRAAIINETMARRYWPGADAIGKRFGNGRDWFTVIGVVGDVKHQALTKEADPEFFEPYAQTPQPSMVLTVRTASDPLRFAPALREAIRNVDRGQPVAHITTMEQRVVDAMGTQRFAALLLAVFGTVALLLAAVGIYGVISFSVARRTREIGVRMALGAAGGDVMRMVVRRAVLLAALGVAAGVAGGLALAKVIRSMLYGVSATDPWVFGAAAVLMLSVAALAAYVPARRASRVSPSEALRYE